MDKSKITLFIIISVLFFACNNSKNNIEEKATAVSGEQLFKINCTQCHRPAEDLTGPALKNATARWKDRTFAL